MCMSFLTCIQLLSFCGGTQNKKDQYYIRPENTDYTYVNINIHHTCSLIAGSTENADAFH